MMNEPDLERLVKLTDQLQAAGSARPYDPDEYNRIVDELNKLLNPLPAKTKAKCVHRIWRTIKSHMPWQV